LKTSGDSLHRRKPSRNEGGFSLVEVMIAMAFFGVTMLGLLSVFPMGARSVQKSEKLTVATGYAEDELERLKELPTNDPDLAAGTHVDPQNPILNVYSRTWTVTDDTPIPGMTTITMNVSYSNNGIMRNVSVTTYLAR
jgi:Tfp pilus assembly protein PilV